ncbi:spermatogenesis-associated protein 7 homolog [Varanus komodoensis]|uniref:spermatogenesis-associated protein 7 homolog n=1 Tax=Varanus komodoensis TaxID=61221 RepID=UPI001CF789BE|nr:spermatogenesis-associated protein 7 homolog [Varanus komodoensis]
MHQATVGVVVYPHSQSTFLYSKDCQRTDASLRLSSTEKGAQSKSASKIKNQKNQDLQVAHSQSASQLQRFQEAMIPKYSLMGPFKGHMSIKSSPFSPSSSCKLSSQYLIQDHMTTHYRKLLSAKAAVDSSAPKSLNMSIKYKDQQKREKLIKAVEKFKKEVAGIHSAPPHHSRSASAVNCENSLNLAGSRRMSSLGEKGQCSPRYFKTAFSHTPSPALSAEENIQDIVQWYLSQMHNHGQNASQQRTAPLTLRSRRKKVFSIPQKKLLGGDLLDTHAQWFTESKDPFTPKVLKTASKSFLSKYRYYNSPNGKKSPSVDQQMHKQPRKSCRSLEDECLKPYADNHRWQPVKKCSQNSVSLQSLLRAKEEESKYLHLLQEVTNDIIIGSCYRKEALGSVFQRHIRNRRCDLDEVKMQRIFQALKDDLNICTNPPDSFIYTGSKNRDSCLNAPCR